MRRHCQDVGRDYEKIEKTVMMPLEPGKNGEQTRTALGIVSQVHELEPLRLLGRVVISAADKF